MLQSTGSQESDMTEGLTQGSSSFISTSPEVVSKYVPPAHFEVDIEGLPCWSRRLASTLLSQVAWVPTLARKLRSHMPCRVAKFFKNVF